MATDLRRKFDGISILSGGGGGKPKNPMAGRFPASSRGSSPASDFVPRRVQQIRYQPATAQSSSNGEEETHGERSTESLSPSRSEQQEASTAQSSSNGGEETERSNGCPSPSRMKSVGRRKDFKHVERVNGRLINVLQGLELHTNVFSAEEQRKIVDCVYDLQEKGRKGQLRERTYTEPRKWMRGKGRVTIQFGCCYNYAVDKYGNPPGIIRDEQVDPLPPLLKSMIKRMVEWRVLPPACIPNSCIVNIYDKDDCIPPHIDHHDFLRPFCTVSFLSECKIIFGTEIKVVGPGDFSGSVAIPLPLGSVLILSGNGADIAKHCVPAVPAKRISITFRRMDESKLPFKFRNDPELQNLRPIQCLAERSQAAITHQIPHTPPSQLLQREEQKDNSKVVAPEKSGKPSQLEVKDNSKVVDREKSGKPSQLQQNDNSKVVARQKSGKPFQLGEHDFPPLGSSSKLKTRPNK